MENHSIYHLYIQDFSRRKAEQKLQKKFEEMERLRRRFVEDFPIEILRELTLEGYLYGKERSFCSRLKNELAVLGTMRTKSNSLWGVWQSQTSGKPPIHRAAKFGDTIEKAFANVKEAIYSLLKSGATADARVIFNSKLSNQFKFRLLATYFPDRFIHFYTPIQWNFFLKCLDVKQFTPYPIRNYFSLLSLKESLSQTASWTMVEYRFFLTEYYGNLHPVRKYWIQTALGKTRQKALLVAYAGVLAKGEQEKDTLISHVAEKEIPYKEEKGIEDKQISQERFILHVERERLKALALHKYADKITYVGDDPSKGCDLFSFDALGRPVVIDIISTQLKSPPKEITLSYCQYLKSKGWDNYYLYILFLPQLSTPKILPIFRPHQFAVVPERKITFRSVVPIQLPDIE